jgi:hypothetical protein
MKCVKKEGKMKRVKDEIALTLTTKLGWEYCPKSEWKASEKKQNNE